MTRVDAVVVGAGGMGASAAWHLARTGRSVLVLEQFVEGHTRGSSHGPTRIFRVAYRDPRYVALGVQALPWWRRLEEESGERLLDQTGQLDHGSPAAIGEIEQALAAAGRPFERLTPAAAHERWPGMQFDSAVVVSPEGGVCAADRTVAALLRQAVARGAEVCTGTRVERVEVLGDDDVVVHTAAGSHRARVVVVAAGAWLGELLGSTVRLPPLAVTQEQPAHFAPRQDGLVWPAFLHHREHASPLSFGAYGMWTPGVGVKVGVDGTGRVADPAKRDSGLDPAGLTAVARYVEAWLPGLDPTPIEATTCLFTSTPDEHFVLDRVGPVVVCSPCSGHGFKFVPVIGHLAARLAAGHTSPDPAWRLPR